MDLRTVAFWRNQETAGGAVSTGTGDPTFGNLPVTQVKSDPVTGNSVSPKASAWKRWLPFLAGAYIVWKVMK